MPKDAELRDHLVRLLTAPWAHITAEAALDGIPAEHRGAKLHGHVHTIWQLVEHLRICQDDLVKYSQSADHESPQFPDGYWPSEEVPPSEAAWAASLAGFSEGLQRMVTLVQDPACDLFADLPWSSEGHTVLREVMILADHNAYHAGQIMQLRKALSTA